MSPSVSFRAFKPFKMACMSAKSSESPLLCSAYHQRNEIDSVHETTHEVEHDMRVLGQVSNLVKVLERSDSSLHPEFIL